MFSGQHVNEGIDALHAYAQLFMNDKQSPPLEWAYLRMAQLQHTLGDAEAVGEAVIFAYSRPPIHDAVSQQLGQQVDNP